MSIVFTWYSPTPTDITANVMFDKAQLTMNTGAQPGDFLISVKDLALTYTFKAGHRLTLDIDGTRYFDGYMLVVTQRFPFYVSDLTQSEERVRIWDLRGSDVGMLFQRRYIFNQSTPAVGYNVNGAISAFNALPAGTSDLSYLNLIMTHLTLAGDGITTDFHAVGSPNPDEKGLAISVGDQWAEAMRLTAVLPGAEWGIRPDRTVYYEDDSTVTAPFAISDTPDNSTSYGYANYTWTNDGTRLINDAQIWGVGLGKNSLTYDRVEDADSIALHGRWQNVDGWRFDLYKQEHVDLVTESLVYGSPEHLHGGKDDQVTVKCRVRQPGLLPGQKVHIISNVYGDDIVLPIRSMTVTFANNHQALFDLTATWDIDNPRSFYDWPPVTIPTSLPQSQGNPPNCFDLTAAPSPWWADSMDDWTVETSDPMLGFVEAVGGTFAFKNKRRYAQMSPVTVLGFGVQHYGDGYGHTKTWSLSGRNFTVPDQHAIVVQFAIAGQQAKGVHVNPFPQSGGPLGTGPFGEQSNLTKPVLELAVNINGVSYWLIDSLGRLGGSGGDYYAADTSYTAEWRFGTGARIYPTGRRPLNPNLSSTEIDNVFKTPETLHTVQFQIYAAMWSDNNWDGTDALNGTGGGVIDDIVTVYPDPNHFFDNNFAVPAHGPSGPPYKGYYINDGTDYSTIEDSVQATIISFIDVFLTTDSVSLLPATCDSTDTQVSPGSIYSEVATSQSSTVYTTKLPFLLGSTQVSIDGIDQRIGIDYTETPPYTITFRTALPADAFVYIQYQVAG